MKKQDKLQLLLTADPAYVPVAARGAEVFSLKRGFDQKTAGQISLAVEEAVINAIEMGFGGMTDEINICMAATSMGVEIAVTSRGLPLHPEQLPQYSLEKAGTRYDTGGLNFFLVKQLMDGVTFSAQISGERQLTLVKRLPLAPADPDMAGEQAARKTAAAPAGHHRIRMARPGDADDISRLVLRAHGKVLFSEDIYYPGRVEEMLRSEKMVSAVAVTREGEIFGHGAVVPMDPAGRISEMTYGFVNPDFRSRGVVSDIARALIRDAQAKQVYALVVLAVTNHIHSQKAAARVGFKGCALLAATSSASAKIGNDGTPHVGRIANMVQVRYINKGAEPPRLYLPHRHSVMIEEIYRHLDRAIDLQPVPDHPLELPQKIAEIRSDSNLMEGWMDIQVTVFGQDILPRVNQLLQEAVLQQISAIQLILPLDVPFTRKLVPDFETAGFFFAGVAPGQGPRECLILQYINTPDPGYENIHVMEGMETKIKNYVLACSRIL